ncbi:hypothetical protein ABHW52_02480 [Pediococcus pentosaceus]
MLLFYYLLIGILGASWGSFLLVLYERRLVGQSIIFHPPTVQTVLLHCRIIAYFQLLVIGVAEGDAFFATYRFLPTP